MRNKTLNMDTKIAEYQPVIGLEVHVQLKTNSKMFCSCPTVFGAIPNTNICPVCTGQPGVLPVANRKAVELSIKTALALGCTINNLSIFARKNYFYPDLPKNYQISQYESPFGMDGVLEIDIHGKAKKIRIKRVHLEEDTGKLLHSIGSTELDYSLIDFNRSGLPLLEIVTEPDITSPEEAWSYLTGLRNLLRYIDVSDCDMEKGSFRCDANISVRDSAMADTGKLGIKTEIKNLNSFKAVKDALGYEINRQVKQLKAGKEVVQETLLWNDRQGRTESMRTKESAHDYRYFPEPDLPPFEFSGNLLEKLKGELPELPHQRKKRFISEYLLTDYDADVLTSAKGLADYFESGVNAAKDSVPPDASLKFAKPFANWVNTELTGRLNARGQTIEGCSVSAGYLARLVVMVCEEKISNNIAKQVLDDMFETGRKPEEIIREKGLTQISDEKEISGLIDKVIEENPIPVEEYRGGKKQALGALVGAVMKKSGGRANPQMVNRILRTKLGG